MQNAFAQNVAAVLIGLVVVLVVVAATYLAAIGEDIPEIIPFIGSAGVGALGGLATNSPGS